LTQGPSMDSAFFITEKMFTTMATLNTSYVSFCNTWWCHTKTGVWLIVDTFLNCTGIYITDDHEWWKDVKVAMAYFIVLFHCLSGRLREMKINPNQSSQPQSWNANLTTFKIRCKGANNYIMTFCVRNVNNKGGLLFWCGLKQNTALGILLPLNFKLTSSIWNKLSLHMEVFCD